MCGVLLATMPFHCLLRDRTGFLQVVMGCFAFPWLFPHCNSPALSTVSAVRHRSPMMAGVGEGQSLLVCFSLSLAHSPVLVLNQHEFLPFSICTVSPGASPGQGCLPAASAPSSPLQTSRHTRCSCLACPVPPVPWRSVAFRFLCNL